MNFPSSKLAMITLFALFSSTGLRAQQVNPGTERGLPAYASFGGSNFDKINLLNENLHFEIPILTLKERGRNFTYYFHYEPIQWTIHWYTLKKPCPTCPDPSHYSVSRSGGSVGLSFSNPTSWSIGFGGNSGSITCNSVTPPQQYQVNFSYSVIDPSGTIHPLPLRQEVGLTCYGSNLSGPALDGSGITYNLSTNIVTLKDGTQITVGNGAFNLEDANGNTSNLSQDMLQRTPVTITQGPNFTFTTPLGKSITRPQYTLYTLTDSNGASQIYRIDYEALDIKSNMCAAITHPAFYGCYEDVDFDLFTKQLTLPDGTTYVFTYNNNTPGELARIDLPTGGSITYTYQDSYFLQTPSPALPPPTYPTYTGRRGVATRTVIVGSNSYQWSYSGGAVTDPLGNVEVHSYVYLSDGTHSSATAYDQGVTYKDSTGKVLRSVKYDYASELNQIDLTLINGRIIRETTTLDNGLVKKTETDYNDTFQHSCGGVSGALSSCTFTRLNPTEVREYDYGSGAPGPLLKRTDYTYLHQNNSAYANLNIIDRPVSVTVYNGSGTKVSQTTYEYDVYNHPGMPAMGASGAVQHDSARNTSYLTRGNATAVSRWLNSTGASLTTYNQYDDAGNLIATKDPNGNLTTLDYTDGWSNTTCAPSGQGKAYITTTTNALGQQSKATYNSCTGSLASSKNQNDINASRNGTTYSYDLLGRTTQVSYPDGGSTTNCFTDVGGSGCSKASAPPYQTVTTRAASPDPNVQTTTVYDVLGRIIQTQVNSASPVIYTDTTYDALSRVQTVSNPHFSTSSSTDGTTAYVYDALSRVCVVVPPDGTAVPENACPATQPTNDTFTVYTGNTTTSTDQAGKSRTSVTDGLGRLTQLTEDPGSSPHLNYLTSYAYDALNNLTSVVQNGSHNRTFVYDSLSRLTSATNPESGTITYTYDANGNPLTKTSPAPNQTGTATVTASYAYDPLNRVTQKSYSDGTPTAVSTYDVHPVWGMADVTNVVGRLVEAYLQVGSNHTSTVYSYDPVGRVVREWQQTPSTWPGGYFVYHSYDLAGDLSSMTNPAGVTISYNIDAAGRPTSVTSSLSDAQHPATLYAVDPTTGYFPSGAVRKGTLANGLTEAKMYNNRLQPCRLNVNSSGTSLAACTDTVPAGNFLDFTYAYNSGTNNGNVASWSSVGNQVFTRSYGYDSLNRLSSLTDTASTQACKGLSWNYDAWGNLLAQNNTGGSCFTFSALVGTNNRLGSPYTYDAAGNVTYDGTHTYTYDAENRLTQVDAGATATYTYDANGARVRKNSASSWTEYFYDGTGEVSAELTPSGWGTEYVYANGRLIAQYIGGTTYSIFADHLGSTRLVTDLNKAVVDSLDYLPFGLQIAGGTATTHKFTGKERDSESGLDNFGARYNSSSLGRFMSVDPAGLLAVNFENPQTLNLYAYTMNNPLRYTDPTGMYVCADSSKCDTKQDKDFEAARQRDLQSKNADERRAAAAYGDPTVANGVSVTFVDKLPGNEAGDVKVGLQGNADGSFTATADVRILKGQGGNQLEQTLGHEGSHIFDGQTFVNNLNSLPPDSPLRLIFPQGVSNIPILNVTKYWTELRAYFLQTQIAGRQNEPLSFGGNIIRPGDSEASKIQGINRFLQDSPVYRVTPQNQGPKQFPEFP